MKVEGLSCMIDFRTFETLEGKKPDCLLDRHPDGKYLAMQVSTKDAYLAAIWNNETKRLAWSPVDAHALAWLRQGTQIAALQNPQVSEDFQFAIYSWPQGSLLQHCPLRFPMGYLFDLLFLRQVIWLCANGRTNVSLAMSLSLFMRTISLTSSKTVISMEKLTIPHDRYLALMGFSGSVPIKKTLIGGKMRIVMSMMVTQQERLKKKLAQ